MSGADYPSNSPSLRDIPEDCLKDPVTRKGRTNINILHKAPHNLDLGLSLRFPGRYPNESEEAALERFETHVRPVLEAMPEVSECFFEEETPWGVYIDIEIGPTNPVTQISIEALHSAIASVLADIYDIYRCV